MTSSTTQSARFTRPRDPQVEAGDRLRDALADAYRAEVRERAVEGGCSAFISDRRRRAAGGTTALEGTLARSIEARRAAQKRLDELSMQSSRVLAVHALEEDLPDRLQTLTDEVQAVREASDLRARNLDEQLTEAQRSAGVDEPEPSAERPARTRSRRPWALAAGAAVIATAAIGAGVVFGGDDGPEQGRAAPVPAQAPDAALKDDDIPPCLANAGVGAAAPVVCGTRSSVLTIVTSRRPLPMEGLAARVMASWIDGSDVIMRLRLRNTGDAPRDLIAVSRPHLTVDRTAVPVALPPTVFTEPGATRRVALRFPLEPGQLAALQRGEGADLALRPGGDPLEPDGRERRGVIRLRPS